MFSQLLWTDNAYERVKQFQHTVRICKRLCSYLDRSVYFKFNCNYFRFELVTNYISICNINCETFLDRRYPGIIHWWW